MTLLHAIFGLTVFTATNLAARVSKCSSDARTDRATRYGDDIVALLQTAKYTHQRSGEDMQALEEATRMLEDNVQGFSAFMEKENAQARDRVSHRRNAQRSTPQREIATLQQELKSVMQQRSEALHQAERDA